METGKPKTNGPVNIEWNWDLDDQWVEMKSVKVGDQEHAFGKEGRFRQKGRCRRCWGGLIGKSGAESAPSAFLPSTTPRQRSSKRSSHTSNVNPRAIFSSASERKPQREAKRVG